MNYLVHMVSVKNGMGDFVYYAKWLKLIAKLGLDQTNNIFLIDCKPEKKAILIQYIEELGQTEPDHPLVVRYNAGEIKFTHFQYGTFDKVNLLKACPEQVFTEQDSFLPICISSGPSDVTHANRVFQGINIKEFHKTQMEACLGIARIELGLLFDENLDTIKELGSLITELPTDLRLKLFTDNFIDNTYIFGYIPQQIKMQGIIELLKSSLVAQKLEHGQVVLILTGKIKKEKLPAAILELERAGKIKLLMPGSIPHKEYQILKRIFLHPDVNSFNLPSGDNTLTECFQTGKLPIYLFKENEAGNDSKSAIFEKLARALLLVKTSSAENPEIMVKGREDCINLCNALSTEDYPTALSFLTPEAIKFFYTLKDDFFKAQAFEHKPSGRKILDTIRSFIQQEPPRESAGSQHKSRFM